MIRMRASSMQLSKVCHVWHLPERTVRRHKSSLITGPAWSTLKTTQEKTEYINGFEFKKRGRKPLLSPNDEAYIVGVTEERARLGVGISKGGMTSLIRDTIRKQVTPELKNAKPAAVSRTYVRDLLKRHKQVAEFKASALDSHHAAAGSSRKIDAFNRNQRKANEQGMQDGLIPPEGIPRERVWNMDEVCNYVSLNYCCSVCVWEGPSSTGWT